MSKRLDLADSDACHVTSLPPTLRPMKRRNRRTCLREMRWKKVATRRKKKELYQCGRRHLNFDSVLEGASEQWVVFLGETLPKCLLLFNLMISNIINVT